MGFILFVHLGSIWVSFGFDLRFSWVSFGFDVVSRWFLVGLYLGVIWALCWFPFGFYSGFIRDSILGFIWVRCWGVRFCGFILFFVLLGPIVGL